MDFYDFSTDTGKINKQFACGIVLKNDDSELSFCPSCKRNLEKLPWYREDIPLTILLSNSNLPDFLSVSGAILISDKVKNIIETEKLNGYHLSEAKVLSRNDISKETVQNLVDRGHKVSRLSIETRQYYRFFIDGKCNLHPSSGVVISSLCPVCNRIRYKKEKVDGLYREDCIEKETWKNTDFFKAPGSASNYCTERFFNIYYDNKFTGLNFSSIKSI